MTRKKCPLPIPGFVLFLHPNVTAGKSTISPVTIFFRDLKDLIFDRSFFLLMISYGLNGGCYYALSPLLSQIIKPSLTSLDYTSAELDVKIGTMAISGFKKVKNCTKKCTKKYTKNVQNMYNNCTKKCTKILEKLYKFDFFSL